MVLDKRILITHNITCGKRRDLSILLTWEEVIRRGWTLDLLGTSQQKSSKLVASSVLSIEAYNILVATSFRLQFMNEARCCYYFNKENVAAVCFV